MLAFHLALPHRDKSGAKQTLVLVETKRGESVSLDSQVGDDENTRLCDVIAGDDDTPAEETESNEFARTLPEAIASLPAKYGDVIKLRVARDLSYEEISAELGISVGTVKSRLSRAREYLRIELEKRA